MKFQQLYTAQSPKEKARLDKLFMNQARRASYEYQPHWSFASVAAEFAKLPSVAQERYRAAVSELFILSDEELTETVGEYREVLIEKGFFLPPSESSDRWISPEEIVADIFGADHPISCLFDIPKRTLTIGLSGLSANSKDQLVRIILRGESPELSRWLVPDTTDIDGVLQRLTPLLPYIFGVGRRGKELDWGAAVSLGLELRRPGHFVDFSAVRVAVVESYADLFAQKVLVFASDASHYQKETLHFGPAYAQMFRKSFNGRAAAQTDKAIAELKSPLVSPAQILHHVSRHEVVRRCVIAAAWHSTDRLGITQQGTLKVSDLRKLAKLLVGKRCAPFEESRIECGVSAMSQKYSDFRGARKSSTYGEFLSQLRSSDIFEELWKSSFFARDTGASVDLIQRLPRDQWMSFSDIGYLDSLRSLRWEGGSSDSLIGLLKYHAFVLGDADIALDKSDEPMAVRLIVQDRDTECVFDGETVAMQPTGEIVVPDNLKLSLLYELASYFSLKSSTTFVVDAEMLSREASAGNGAAEVISKISTIISGEVPVLVQRMIRDTLGQAKSAYVGLHECFVCVEDDESAAVIKNLLREKIRKSFGERCFVLAPGNYRTLEEKLKKAGVKIESNSIELRARGW